MLVLSRERHEQIVIGREGDVLTGPIVITCCEVRSDKARIGIECQRDIAVHRSEVADKIALSELDRQ